MLKTVKNRLYNLDAEKIAETERLRQREFGYSPSHADLVIAGVEATLEMLKKKGQYWRHHKCWVVKIPESM